MSGGPGGRREQILNLEKYLDKKLRIKFMGGREVAGLLKGFDQLHNLVLDEAIEYLRDEEDSTRITDETRNLGLIVCRGTTVTLICPVDGTEEIENPFAEAEE